MCLDSGLLVSSYSPEHQNPKPEGEEFIPKMQAPPLLWEKVLCVDDIHYDDVCAKSQITLDLWKERFGGRSSTFGAADLEPSNAAKYHRPPPSTAGHRSSIAVQPTPLAKVMSHSSGEVIHLDDSNADVEEVGLDVKEVLTWDHKLCGTKTFAAGFLILTGRRFDSPHLDEQQKMIFSFIGQPAHDYLLSRSQQARGYVRRPRPMEAMENLT